jgi:hypothetical protein
MAQGILMLLHLMQPLVVEPRLLNRGFAAALGGLLLLPLRRKQTREAVDLVADNSRVGVESAILDPRRSRL